MADRLDFRTPTQDTDTPVIGAFGGLSSASYSTSGNVTHSQKLVNALVNKRNEIARRQGSTIVASVQGITDVNADLLSSHSFTFDNREYILIRENYNLRLLAIEDNSLVGTLTKTNIFTLSRGVERTMFTTVIEDNICYVVCCQKFTPPIVLVILKRGGFISSKTSNTSFNVSIANYPASNVVNEADLFFYNSQNKQVPVITCVQSSFTLSLTTAVPVTETVDTAINVHLVFACVGISAAYYPGTYFYNTAVRKNLVALDVNVEIPKELVSNPIITEPSIQDLSLNTLEAYKTNGNPATAYTRVFNRQPTTADTFEFSDGSYRVDPTLFTTRTPAFIAFGALQTPNNETKVYMFRNRVTSILMPYYTMRRSRLAVYVDKTLTTVNTYTSSGTPVTDDTLEINYYSLGKTNSPGINLSAVVEIFYRQNNVPANPVVDLSDTANTVTIDDRFQFPVYGLAAIADVGSEQYPSICQTVGNRVVLSGFSNKISLSNSDWSYRGISWNNFQVSTIEFSETSAYLVSLTQSTSVVKAVISVSGVIFVFTDSGVYRISGSSANVPPNATTTNVSRVSNEVVLSQSCVTIYNNKVFYVSKNGLYSLEYNKDNEEINALSLSAEVSDYFTNFTPQSITYSEYYRGFLVSFVETSAILVYLLETETYTTFRLSTSAAVKVTPTLDGYQATINTTTAGIKHTIFCKWDSSLTDMSNALSSLPPNSIVSANQQTFTEVSQPNLLVTPAELLDTLNTNLRQTYGKDNARAVSGNITIAEGTTNNNPLPIISAMVTKGFYNSKLIASGRVRALNLLVSGSGTAIVKIVYQAQDFNDRVSDIRTIVVNSDAGYSGEGLLNYQYATQTAVGDNTNIRIRFNGVSEAWEAAIYWTGDLKLLGYQFDSSVKKRGRLR